MRVFFAAALLLIHASISATELVGIGDDELAQRIEAKDWDYVRDYVEAGGDVFWRSEYYNTPLLSYVIAGGERELAFQIIEKGALFDLQNSDEFEELILSAMSANDMELGRAFLALRRDFSFELDADALETLLRRAVLRRQLEFIDLLIESGADINYGDGTLLETAIVMDAKTATDFFGLLIDRGARFDAVETSSRLLRIAARVENVAAMRTLLDGGAEVNHVDGSGYTPLMAAVESDGSGVDVIELLLDSGADPCAQTIEDKTAYDYAVALDKMDLLNRFPQLTCSK